MHLCDFLDHDVINICDGNRIGIIVDIIFAMPLGQIESIVVSPCLKRFLFRLWSRKEDIIIPWCNVVTVGIDAILVNVV